MVFKNVIHLVCTPQKKYQRESSRFYSHEDMFYLGDTMANLGL